MKLGLSSYTFPWAIGLPDAPPERPLTALQLLEKAQELGVGLVQFGPNMPLDNLPDKELHDVVKHANSWEIDLEMGTVGIAPEPLRDQIQFAKRIGAILIKTMPEHPAGCIPTRTEIANSLRAVVDELAQFVARCWRVPTNSGFNGCNVCGCAPGRICPPKLLPKLSA